MDERWTAAAGRGMGGSMGGPDVLEALRGLPGGAELLGLAAGREDVALVGGAVRDLLRGRTPRELDVVVAGDAGAFAAELAGRLHGPAALEGGQSPNASLHERFGTAVVRWGTGRLDIAERRGESYPAPGALPQVRPGSLEEDLHRRDFTVNAIAVPLGGPKEGELQAVENALEDLGERRLRVLHEGSFIDDPTRLLRLARYRARLGFEVESHTAELAREALSSGAIDTVSRARIGAELRLALAEPDPVAALASMRDLGVLSALDERLELEEDLARGALALLPADGRADLLLIASLLLGLSADPEEDPELAMFELLDGLEFTAADRQRTMRTALVAPSLAREIGLAERPSELHETLFAHTLEAAVLSAELSPGRESELTREWLHSLRHVELEITGDDLLAAGLSPGPEIGIRLETALSLKLDGELAGGREAELRAALEAQV